MSHSPVMYYVLAKHRKHRDAERNITFITEKVEIVKETDLDQYPEWEGWSTVSTPLTRPEAKKECKKYKQMWLNKA